MILQTAPVEQVKPAIRAEGKNIPAAFKSFISSKHLTKYAISMYDLNDDGVNEGIVYAMSSSDKGLTNDGFCGSGGCWLFVIAQKARNYKVISSTSITNLPVKVLRTKSNGWHDLSVMVQGGGITVPYASRLRFDGKSYPKNPATPPATPVSSGKGIVLIGNYPGS